MEGLLLQPREVLDVEGRLLCPGASCASARGADSSLGAQTLLPVCTPGKGRVQRESKEKMWFAENTSNATPAPSAKVRQKKGQFYG